MAAIQIPTNVRKAIERGFLVLEVTSPTPDPLYRALVSFRSAIDDIGQASNDPEWPGPAWLDEVMPTPGSCLFSMDLGEPPREIASRVILELIRALGSHGVESPSIGLPRTDGPHSKLETLPNCVMLRAFVRRSTRFPRQAAPVSFDPSWVREAFEWVGPGDPLQCSIVSSEFALPRQSARDFAPKQIVKGYFKFSTGDIEESIRLASFFNHKTNLVLAAGGPAVKPEDLVRFFGELAEAGRRLAPWADYAFIEFTPTFLPTLLASPSVERDRPIEEFPSKEAWNAQGASADYIWHFIDSIALDAYPWQVLGPGHLERTGGVPVGGEMLPSGMCQVTIGRPEEWLDRSTLDEIQRLARDRLQRCLTTLGEIEEVLFGPEGPL